MRLGHKGRRRTIRRETRFYFCVKFFLFVINNGVAFIVNFYDNWAVFFGSYTRLK
jgi:hypothetical protein